MKIIVGDVEKGSIELKVEDERILLTGNWKGRVSKSKKGNFNMFWCKKEEFDSLIQKYMDGDESVEDGRDSPPF